MADSKEVFGEPEAGDGTARFDARAERAAQRYNELSEKMARVLNRPMGSKKVALPDQLFDYQTEVQGNIAQQVDIANNLMAVWGPAEGTRKFVEYVEKMERKARE